MVAINKKYVPRKAGNSGPANPAVAGQRKQGYQFEQLLGLQYVRQRWYDPVTRQFISQDPLGFPDGTVPWSIESGHVSGALVRCPFALVYESGRNSYRHAVANTTILATRHIEHGGSAIGAGPEAVAYNILSWFGIKSILEGGAGTTLVHPQSLSTGERFLKVGSGALQFVIVAAPEIKEFLPGIGGAAPADAVAARSFRLGGQDYEQLREGLRSVTGVLRNVHLGAHLADSREGVIRFFYDPRDFRIISKGYWDLRGPAAGRSLHHWLFPQRWKWVPFGIRNAGFNLLELPELKGLVHPTLSLNTYMGFARGWNNPAEAARAVRWEWGIRIAIPASPIVGGTVGYGTGKWIEKRNDLGQQR